MVHPFAVLLLLVLPQLVGAQEPHRVLDLTRIAEPPARPPTPTEAILRDRTVVLKYLKLKLARLAAYEQAGQRDRAIDTVEDVLAQERKYLERCLWWTRKDATLRERGKQLKEGLEGLKKLRGEAALADRVKLGYRPSPEVADPLGDGDIPQWVREASHLPPSMR